MATGDVTISIAIEGGATKSAVFDSDTRTKAKAYIRSIPHSTATDLSVDANWQVYIANDFAQMIVDQANEKAIQDAIPTPKTFTAAS